MRGIREVLVQDEGGAQAARGQAPEVRGRVAVDVQDARAALAADAHEVGAGCGDRTGRGRG